VPFNREFDMSNTEALFVWVTVPDMDTADDLARMAVRHRLAACANRIGPIGSVYRWDGDIVVDDEFVLVFKTSVDRFDALRAAIVASHPYECPCVLGMPVVGGHQPWLEWLAAETRTSGGPSGDNEPGEL
jgi:periplasmic divalent cation tolerance protein